MATAYQTCSPLDYFHSVCRQKTDDATIVFPMPPCQSVARGSKYILRIIIMVFLDLTLK